MKKALFIGRFAPLHKGHVEAIMELTKHFDEVVIGIGSCYEVGSPRHPFLAIHREKMILSSLYHSGCDMSKIKIAHVQDFPTFGEWLSHISELVKIENITHFVTGNKEDILNVLEKENIDLNLEIINPELNSTVPYHATDLRQALRDGDYAKFLEIAAFGTIALMGSINGFQGLKESLENEAPKFYGGRQTTDVVVTLSSKIHGNSGQIYYKDYVLCGIRDKDKKDFPNYLGLPGGAINSFESPLNAAIRSLEEKARFNVKLLDNKYEPAPIELNTSKGKIITTLGFLKLFNSSDIKFAGTYGGSSQCYHIPLYGNVDDINNFKDTDELKNISFMRIEDAINEGLAYEQTEMVKVAKNHLYH